MRLRIATSQDKRKIHRYRRIPDIRLIYWSFPGVNVGSAKRVHPTQKPVELLEYLIKTYTNEGETVLDNCMGSGSTGVACANIGRKFIGIELDKQYFNIAESRIKEAFFNAKNDKEKEVITSEYL